MVLLILLLLSIPALTTIQLYNNIDRANATNQNQQIITIEYPAITTTAYIQN